MALRFPTPLRPGDTIGVTSPSSGVWGPAAVRIDFCVAWLRRRGFEVVVGDCMDGTTHISAPGWRRCTATTSPTRRTPHLPGSRTGSTSPPPPRRR